MVVKPVMRDAEGVPSNDSSTILGRIRTALLHLVCTHTFQMVARMFLLHRSGSSATSFQHSLPGSRPLFSIYS